ncbi:MAG: diaminopimelate epimerase [Flavobacteriaceae bacterium]|nr:diaminopimelate epimerase [Flavobacteriaceae bacterium]
MKIKFQKFQGAGNDFIIINNKDLSFPSKNNKLIKKLCDRKFGIGCDGLILINPSKDSDFEMIYYNSDGKEGSMCGNGARCSVKFAKINNIIISKETSFKACDGSHSARIDNNMIYLSMNPVKEIINYKEDLFLDTGSPHYVKIVNNLRDYKVFENGKKIRNSSFFNKNGVNVNFVEQISEDEFSVRTYERGVENETFSCGTGVTAVAISMFHLGKTNSNNIKIFTKGGNLSVEFKHNDKGFFDIKLIGKAELVFSGVIEI